MIIIGAGGFAKELLNVCHELNITDNLVFFDNVNHDVPTYLFDKFKILKNDIEVLEHFKEDKAFALGVGHPKNRSALTNYFENLGGELTSIVSPKAHIGCYGVNFESGATILAGASVTGAAEIGKGLLMYPNSSITHDCHLGKFVEISPGAQILGNSLIEDFVSIGANATILPNLKIGSKAIIGAGAVVTKDIHRNTTVKGIPAK